MFSPFNLPSNPEVVIQLREMTAREALELAEISPEHEEALTTSFLNAIQDPGSFRNSSSWTGDDRRFALYWYSLHTLKDRLLSIPYDCPHCKEPHVNNFDLKALSENWGELVGKPFRDHKGWRVSPLTGLNLEHLELMRLELAIIPKDSREYRKKKAEIRFETLAAKLSLPNDLEKDSFVRQDKVKTKLAALPFSEFRQLKDDVAQLQQEMSHGLDTEIKDGRILVLTPEHKCPVKGVPTVLQIPFRNRDHIPGL